MVLKKEGNLELVDQIINKVSGVEDKNDYLKYYKAQRQGCIKDLYGSPSRVTLFLA
jgi:hypothetical protein